MSGVGSDPMYEYSDSSVGIINIQAQKKTIESPSNHGKSMESNITNEHSNSYYHQHSVLSL